MHLELRLEDGGHPTEHDLWIVRTEDVVELEVDGETYEATVHRDPDGSVEITFGDRTVKVDVLEDRLARIDGQRVAFELTTFEPGGAPGEHDDVLVEREGLVHPPMSGKILSVDVEEGDTVEAGDRLAVLEAMKMQSAIEAPRDGAVLRIHVGEGDTVEERDLLFEVGDP